MEVRCARARSYSICVSQMGVVYPSCAAAWRAHLATPTPTTTSLTNLNSHPPLPNSPEPKPTPLPLVSEAMATALASCSLSASTLPPGVTSCFQAAFSRDCCPLLRNYCLGYVDLFGPDLPLFMPVPRPPSPPPLPIPHQPGVCALSLVRDRAAARLRACLPAGCEQRMLGSPAAYAQAPARMREAALAEKFAAAAGPQGSAADRDRRDIARYLAFCKLSGVSEPWPVYSIVFICFVKAASAKSAGSRGGATVEYSIKTSFAHLRDNFGLQVDFDSPLMLNTIKPYKGDAQAATSPTQLMVDEWERLAFEAKCPIQRAACQVAVLCTYLTLRASHLVGATVLGTATDTDVRLNLPRDKDGSTNVWAGCDARGQRGPFRFWPRLMQDARARGYLFCDAEFGSCIWANQLKNTQATRANFVSYFTLAFTLVGVSPERQKSDHFTGHSPRHYLPCFAELLLWVQKFIDEVGRWATGAANERAHKSKCGPRYAVEANQVIQLHLRRRLVAVLAALRPSMIMGEAGLTPCFASLSECDALLNHKYFGPQGVGYIPPSHERL